MPFKPWSAKKPKEDAKQELRKLFKDGKKWTWKQLLEKKIRSPAILIKILKEMVKDAEIDSYKDAEDGRITIYEGLTEKIKAKMELYEMKDFLDSMQNINFELVSINNEGEQNRAEWKIFYDDPMLETKKLLEKGSNELSDILDSMGFVASVLCEEMGTKKFAFCFIYEKE